MVLANLPADSHDRRRAAFVVAALLLAFLAAAPFATAPLAPFPGFVLIYQAALSSSTSSPRCSCSACCA